MSISFGTPASPSKEESFSVLSRVLSCNPLSPKPTAEVVRSPKDRHSAVLEAIFCLSLPACFFTPFLEVQGPIFSRSEPPQVQPLRPPFGVMISPPVSTFLISTFPLNGLDSSRRLKGLPSSPNDSLPPARLMFSLFCRPLPADSSSSSHFRRTSQILPFCSPPVPHFTRGCTPVAFLLCHLASRPQLLTTPSSPLPLCGSDDGQVCASH